MVQKLLSKAACIADLKQLTRKRIPLFAYEYLIGGCNHDIAVKRNRCQLDQVTLQPQYLQKCAASDLRCTIFNQPYAAPFGVAPLGLSGLIWPKASLYHASAANAANIPYILSTLASISIEQAAQCAKNNFWFQLYPPSDLGIRADLIARAQAVGCKNLVITIDVPIAGYRPADIKNGLSVPPKITAKSILQTCLRPRWAFATAKQGMPEFASMLPYMKKMDNLEDVANYIRNNLKEAVNFEMLKKIRQDWSGNLIVKGILSPADANLALQAGADAIIVSSHGGRQLDASKSSIEVLEQINEAVSDKLVVMVDSGVESGVDIARFLACGAQMVFAGRAFMYAVGGLGEPGATHVIDILKTELQQVMEQLRCNQVDKLPQFRQSKLRSEIR